jgi:hypothetical protein
MVHIISVYFTVFTHSNHVLEREIYSLKCQNVKRPSTCFRLKAHRQEDTSLIQVQVTAKSRMLKLDVACSSDMYMIKKSVFLIMGF